MKYAGVVDGIIGFFDDEFHKNIPENSVPITDEEWKTAISGGYDFNIENGKFVLTPKQPPTEEQLNAIHNAEIIRQIEQIEKKQLRATREVLLGCTESKIYLEKLNAQIAELRKQIK